MMNRRRTLLRIAGSTALVGALGFAPVRAQALIPVKIGVIGSSGQAELTYFIKTYGLDRKHGLDVEVVDYAAPGQQYNLLRAGNLDVAIGNFVDLLRQRKAGVDLVAFYGFQGFANQIVVKPDSPIKDFTGLKGRRIGQFGTTFLDWLIIRAAGKKAYGLDLEKDATLVQGAPPMLNQLLSRGEVDATLQFSALTLAPVLKGEQRVIVELPDLLRRAGFNPAAFYLQWFVTQAWSRANPSALGKLAAAFDDAYALLKSGPNVAADWSALAQKVRVTEPTLIDAYRDKARKIDAPTYDASLLEPTRALLDALIEVAGEQAVGVRFDPAAFVFPQR
jgi:NitT/TauT family transport system substrate-binding protein